MIEDRRVYGVEGIDTADAIAMRIGPDGTQVLLVPQYARLPAAACRLLTRGEREACEETAPTD